MGQAWGREKNADSRDTQKLLPVELADVGRGMGGARTVVAWIFGLTLRQARPVAGVDESGGEQTESCIQSDTSNQRRQSGRLPESETLQRRV